MAPTQRPALGKRSTDTWGWKEAKRFRLFVVSDCLQLLKGQPKALLGFATKARPGSLRWLRGSQDVLAECTRVRGEADWAAVVLRAHPQNVFPPILRFLASSPCIC